MNWLFLFGVVIASIPMLAFALWFAGPIDEVFNWLTDDSAVALNFKEGCDAARGVVTRQTGDVQPSFAGVGHFHK